MSKEVAFVIDDAEKSLHDPKSQLALKGASSTGMIFEASTSMNLPHNEREKLAVFLRGLDRPIGLHTVFDDAPQSPIYQNNNSLFGVGGLLETRRLHYEKFKKHGFNTLAWAISQLTRYEQDTLERMIEQTIMNQIGLFNDEFHEAPANLNTHNGWWGDLAVMQALLHVADKNKLPVRANRREMPQWINRALPGSPWETGTIIDSHNIPGRTNCVNNPTCFAEHISTAMTHDTAAEVIMHVHATVEPHYHPHTSLMASPELPRALERLDIVPVSSKALISHRL